MQGTFNGTQYVAGVGIASTSLGTDLSWWWYLLLIIPFLIVVFVCYYVYQKKNQKKDISRVLRAWRAKARSSWFPKMEEKDAFKEPAEVWSRPPPMVAMRTNLDPFVALPSKGEEGDIDTHTKAFVPRAQATIRGVDGAAVPTPSSLPREVRSSGLKLGNSMTEGSMGLPALRGLASIPATRLPPLHVANSVQRRMSTDSASAVSGPPRLTRPLLGPGGSNKIAPASLPPPNQTGLHRFPSLKNDTSTSQLTAPKALPRTDPFQVPRRTSMELNDPFMTPRGPGPDVRNVDPFARPGPNLSTTSSEPGSEGRRRSSVSMPQRPNFRTPAVPSTESLRPTPSTETGSRPDGV